MTEILLVVLLLVAAAALVVALGAPARVAREVKAALGERLDAIAAAQPRVEQVLRAELAESRKEASLAADRLREETRSALKGANDSSLQALGQFGERLDRTRAELGEANAKLRADLMATLEQRLEALRDKVDERLKGIQEENGKRLEEMRQTVDEKLQKTLETRLGTSFELVRTQLEAVQQGLGEMKSLATGVGDLKKVLSNVKVRGTWGEVQLGALLEQVLSPDQYAANVAPRKDTGERVEFCIRLPGRDGGGEVLLPIDAKFPVEDYQRLVEASERGDAAAVEECAKALEARIKGCAKDIHDKYVHPPATTDFGILFLPTESLYAEVVRRSGLVEFLQREHKVSVAGPTTLAAMLNSLQMGFRTLAIQKRSSEVWQVLSAVKSEFGKFGEVLEAVDKKLGEASKKIHAVGVRRRAIERTLRDVATLPAGEAQPLALPFGAPEPEPEEEEDVEEGVEAP